MAEIVYILLVVGCYCIIRDVYCEEHGIHISEVSWPKSIVMATASLLIFFSLFIILAYYTIKYPPHEEI